jgi:uncharacterized protein YjbI with pentapeptide repeats
MTQERANRLNYEESCCFLQKSGYLAEGAIPVMPLHRPEFGDDGPHGVGFYKTFIVEGGFENLTLPRTFFGRSEVGPISFRNTDLSESTLCWNDFNEVDFTDAELRGCDFRASIFNAVKFIRANLYRADLRRSTFNACDFTGAIMRGAKLTREQAAGISFSDE